MRGFEQLVWRVVTNPHTGILLMMVISSVLLKGFVKCFSRNRYLQESDRPLACWKTI